MSSWLPSLSYYFFPPATSVLEQQRIANEVADFCHYIELLSQQVASIRAPIADLFIHQLIDEATQLLNHQLVAQICSSAELSNYGMDHETLRAHMNKLDPKLLVKRFNGAELLLNFKEKIIRHKKMFPQKLFDVAKKTFGICADILSRQDAAAVEHLLTLLKVAGEKIGQPYEQEHLVSLYAALHAVRYPERNIVCAVEDPLKHFMGKAQQQTLNFRGDAHKYYPLPISWHIDQLTLCISFYKMTLEQDLSQSSSPLSGEPQGGLIRGIEQTHAHIDATKLKQLLGSLEALSYWEESKKKWLLEFISFLAMEAITNEKPLEKELNCHKADSIDTRWHFGPHSITTKITLYGLDKEPIRCILATKAIYSIAEMADLVHPEFFFLCFTHKFDTRFFPSMKKAISEQLTLFSPCYTTSAEAQQFTIPDFYEILPPKQSTTVGKEISTQLSTSWNPLGWLPQSSLPQ